MKKTIKRIKVGKIEKLTLSKKSVPADGETHNGYNYGCKAMSKI